jgi:hypothetical protein
MAISMPISFAYPISVASISRYAELDRYLNYKKSFSNLTRTPDEHPLVIVGCWRAEKNWKNTKK